MNFIVIKRGSCITSMLLLVLLLFPLLAQAKSIAKIDTIRHWISPKKTQLVFSSNRRIQPHVFQLKQPSRIVIDLQDVRLDSPFPKFNLAGSNIKRVRYARHNGNDLRVVLDLKKPAEYRELMLNPNSYYGYRFIVDVFSKSTGNALSQTTVSPKVYKSIKDLEREQRDLIVAIDAGHGGEDPGAIGYRGTREKTVVLSIAKRLHKLVQREPGMRPVMIRSGDYYLSLRERMQQAREQKADVFVSIHADAAENRRARGGSVYILSQKGASSEAARWLADSQNKSDLIGGVDLDGENDMLKSVLLDLTQNATLAASSDLGELVLKQLNPVAGLHSEQVEKAGFVVLKSPDIPSILVESGFISHRKEEKLLKNSRHQLRIAKAILKGVRSYFQANALPGTRFAKKARQATVKPVRTYKIQHGDTLTNIAERYNISRYRLKTFNSLVSDRIRVGEILRIPLTSGG